MTKKEIIVPSSQVLDARFIALLVQEASRYTSTVHINIHNKQINAKSIMGMMTLKMLPDESMALVTNGRDEEVAAEGMEAFFRNAQRNYD